MICNKSVKSLNRSTALYYQYLNPVSLVMWVIISGFAYSRKSPKFSYSFVYDQLSWSCGDIIYGSQFGFCKSRSTVENPVVYQAEAFGKEFDRVNFKVLVTKLSALGFSEQLIKWTLNFAYCYS